MSSNDRFIRAAARIGNIERSAFKSLSHSYKSSLNVGELVPVLVQEVLPGDTFKIDTHMVGRLQTPLAPVMDNLYFEYFYFFVPTRLIWSNFKYFMGEQKSAWVDNTIYQIPSVPLNSLEVEKKSFLDYIGVPPGAYDVGDITIPISVLPRRAYDLIWNEWFRDQNLQDPLITYESIDTPGSEERLRLASAEHLHKANKKHDYFTSCLPAPQKGPSVYIPFSDLTLPVMPLHEEVPHQPVEIQMKDMSGDLAAGYNLGVKYPQGTLTGKSSSDFNSGGKSLSFLNLWATNRHGDASIGAPTINALRFAFQVQKIYERDARSGSRYVEILRSHFGVISPDSRQQRPEFLFGGSEIVGMQQQVATASGGNEDSVSNLGDVGAFSYTSHSKEGVERSFTEHGYLIGLATLRYRHTYTQGIPKYLTRIDRFDFYDPALAHLGEQPVFKSELYVDYDLDGDLINGIVFGYNEAWADYRYNLNRCTATMRPTPGEIGNLWTYADLYNTLPSLSADWIEEDLANVERTLALTSSLGVDNFFFDIYFDIYAIRPMPLYSVPGLIDHF